VVSDFIVQALLGQDTTIFGDGRQTRSFQYVADLLEGMIRVIETSDDFVGPVNIGNPVEFTKLELAKQVIDLTGTKSKLVFQPLPQDDPKQRCPEISLARAELAGWEPRVQLREGLERTIGYFDEHFSILTKQ
jgi:UDP-glucuronate decarboxylase